MNVFFLSRNTAECARWHTDQHVIKMVIEAAQLLSTAWHQLQPTALVFEPLSRCCLLNGKRIFNETHRNHPMAIWTRQNAANYQYVWNYGLDLADEYFHRWGSRREQPYRHATQAILETLGDMPECLPDESMTDPPLCMPDEFKVEGDPTLSYRRYYIGAKLTNANYTHRERPEWASQSL